MFVSKFIKYLLMGAALIALNACGNNDSSNPGSTPSANTTTGTYVDSAVSGVSYICGTEQGSTGENGGFTFEIGESCTFSLNGITLRNVEASALSEGITIFEDNLLVAQILQTLDNDGNASNGISIDADIVALLGGTLPSTQAELDTLVALLLQADANGSILYDGHSVTEQEAQAHLEETRQSLDHTAPIITLLGNALIEINHNADFIDPGISAVDDFYASEDINISISGLPDTKSVGTYTIVYTATDGAGNSASVSRTVNVLDISAPVITVAGENPLTLTQGESYIEEGATAFDDTDGSVAVFISGSVDTNIIGSYTITYRAYDVAENEGIATRTVQVIQGPDTTPPVITVLGSNPFTLTAGDGYSDEGATALDDRDGIVSVITSGSVNSDVANTYIITYTAKDDANNTATATRTVTVDPLVSSDTTPPVITVLGENPFTLTVGDSYSDEGATALDDIDGVVSVTTSGSVNSNVANTYIITYTAKDDANNTATATRTVTVEDVVIPIVVKKTGQILSYDENGSEISTVSARDDGHYQTGSTTQYTRDDDQNITTDHLLGLMWQDDPEVGTLTKPWLTSSAYTSGQFFDTSGDTAASYCSNLSLGGHTDWRLPSLSELLSIRQTGTYSPALDTIAFNHNSTDYLYWSSSNRTHDAHDAWYVHFSDGSILYAHKNLTAAYVRCVRTIP
ncbi:MAG: hypothetical protein DRQ78_04050 [Epsilonproteobacteria bacterium]|nr:MAG: hypothetical protein DRQ78_04050 [Campylobacterota bacterium]